MKTSSAWAKKIDELKKAGRVIQDIGGGSKGIAKAAPKKKKKNKGSGPKITWSLPLLLKLLSGAGLPDPELEYIFHETRKWRFDLAWPELKIALEINGGVWTNGGHNRAKGYIEDVRKQNAAIACGWVVVITLPEWIPGDYTMGVDSDFFDNLIATFELRSENKNYVWTLDGTRRP